MSTALLADADRSDAPACVNHINRRATHRCYRCGLLMCAGCRLKDHRGQPICYECVLDTGERPVMKIDPPPPSHRRLGLALIAAAAALVPGILWLLLG